MEFRRRKKVAADRDISLSTQKRVEKDPRHPKPVQYTEGCVVFVGDEIDAYDALIIAEARAALGIKERPGKGSEAATES